MGTGTRRSRRAGSLATIVAGAVPGVDISSLVPAVFIQQITGEILGKRQPPQGGVIVENSSEFFWPESVDATEGEKALFLLRKAASFSNVFAMDLLTLAGGYVSGLLTIFRFELTSSNFSYKKVMQVIPRQIDQLVVGQRFRKSPIRIER